MKCLALFLLLSLPLAAQSSQDQSSQQKIKQYVEANQPRILAEFVDLLKLENVALRTDKGRADIERNAEFIVQMLAKRGITARILTVEGGFPAVYAEVLTPGATKTVAFYAHYDGQPVDPAKWKTPPFEPMLFDTAGKPMPLNLNPGIVPDPARSKPDDFRLYARGASDDKAGVLGLIVALDALKASGIQPSVNIKLFFEGEEEAGSDRLAAILEKYAAELKSDLWILCDGPVHQSGRLQLVFGARGVMGLEMTVFGPNRALHSGHYGNWSPNPALDLAHLLAGMRDSKGPITIPGFYDRVRKPTPAELTALARFPDVDANLKTELALGRTLKDRDKLDQRIERSVMEPALNIRGIRAGNVGDAATNSIMTEATASIDFRLVPDQTIESVKLSVEQYLRQRGVTLTANAPTALAAARFVRLQWQPGYPPMRTSFDAPAAQAMHRTIEAAFPKQKPLLRLPTLGGSVPMYIFERQFKVPVMILPIANYDNNQHASNENIRLGNLWQGMEVFGALMADLGKQWK